MWARVSRRRWRGGPRQQGIAGAGRRAPGAFAQGATDERAIQQDAEPAERAGDEADGDGEARGASGGGDALDLPGVVVAAGAERGLPEEAARRLEGGDRDRQDTARAARARERPALPQARHPFWRHGEGGASEPVRRVARVGEVGEGGGGRERHFHFTAALDRREFHGAVVTAGSAER